MVLSLSSFLQKLARRKTVSTTDNGNGSLDRCLTTFDLIGLGVGSTLGAGLYVVTGQVAQGVAGPAVTLSFLVAALASALAGLCYAEFAARIPKAGSAYVYSYVTVGELMAFVIGWNLILEYVIGTASVARGWSSYVDFLAEKRISTYLKDTVPIHVEQLSQYPDFLAFGITILLTVLLAVGVKESTRFNNVFTGINLMVVLYVSISGAFKADLGNWQLEQVPSSAGQGGFVPFGFSGVMEGAATCFYAFVGFDCVATCGEETRNPQKSIPIAIVVSLIIIAFSYISVSGVITLMCPYFLLDRDAALPFVFEYVGWGVATYIITVGALCGLSTSLLGAMFPLPRILYAMGGDGLLFRPVGHVSERFKTPLLGTALSGIFAGSMAMLFNLKELVDMMSIGTLLAYTLVSVSVLILRYEGPRENRQKREDTNDNGKKFKLSMLLRPQEVRPTHLTSTVVRWTVTLLCVLTLAFSSCLVYGADYLNQKSAGVILYTCMFMGACLACCVVIGCQPQAPARLPFMVPCVPAVPALSIFVNIYLMLRLSSATWVRFSVWMVAGFAIYFLYGVWNSSEGQRHKDSDTDLSSGEADGEGETMKKRGVSDTAFTEGSQLVKHDQLQKYSS